jgi:hypothetical protein
MVVTFRSAMEDLGIMEPWEDLESFPLDYDSLVNFPVPLLRGKNLEQIQDACQWLFVNGSEITTLRPSQVGTGIYGRNNGCIFSASVSNRGLWGYTEQRKPNVILEILGELGLYRYSPLLSVASNRYHMLAADHRKAVAGNISDLEGYARDIRVLDTHPADAVTVNARANTLEANLLYASVAAKFFGGNAVVYDIAERLAEYGDERPNEMPWSAVKLR